MAHRVSPETTVYVRAAGGGGGGAAAGSGSGAGTGACGSFAAAGTTSGVGASVAGGGVGAWSVCVFDAHAGPSNPYSTRLRSSCSSRRTSLAPLVSVCQIGSSGVYSTQLPSFCTSRRSAFCPLVPVAHTDWPPAYSTRLPSSCKVSVYAPLRDVSDCPRSSFSPFISLSPMPAELTDLGCGLGPFSYFESGIKAEPQRIERAQQDVAPTLGMVGAIQRPSRRLD